MTHLAWLQQPGVFLYGNNLPTHMDIYVTSQSETIIIIARLLLDEADEILNQGGSEPPMVPVDNLAAGMTILNDLGGLDRIESVRHDPDRPSRH